MKRFNAMIIVIIILITLTGCNRDNEKNLIYDTNKINSEVIQGNSQFAFNIFRELNKQDKGKNIFISPLSISTALTMTFEGARGTTKEGMEKALAYVGLEIPEINESYQNLLPYLNNIDKKVELDINNSIWFRKGEKINQAFLDTNNEVFDAYITEIDFSENDSANKINKWIEDATNEKITKMINQPISPDTIMYLINAIYFKGEWTEQFKEENTYRTTFLSEQEQEKEVELMVRKDEIDYTSDTKYKAIRLPYGNEAVSMYCLLPNEGSTVNDLIDWLDEEKWQGIKNHLLKVDDVTVKIPKFKLEYGIKNLNESLMNLGMGEAFSDSADFSGIRDDLFISRVLHKAVIEVNEEGSEAAAVTVVEMDESAAVEEPITFIADRPFLFIIADDELGNILFMGKLSDM